MESLRPSMREVLGDPFLKEAFSPSQKREIREASNGCCVMCGKAEAKPNKQRFQAHHKIPISAGGKDVIENGAFLCQRDHLVADTMFLQYGILFNDLLYFINGKK